MEMARICRERFENVKKMCTHMILDINILSYQNIKFLRRFVAKKIKLENIKNINVRTYYIYNLDLLLLVQMS